MALVSINWKILLDLSRHVPTEIHTSQILALSAQIQYDRTRKLVMGRPSPFGGFEDMY